MNRTFRNSKSRRPLILQNIQTNRSICIDIWVVDSCSEIDLICGTKRGYQTRRGVRRKRRVMHAHKPIIYLWGLEGIVCGEMNRQEIDATTVRTLSLMKADEGRGKGRGSEREGEKGLD